MLDLTSLSLTLILVGLIWMVQVVHYPFFQWVPEERFLQAMDFHQRRISLIVIPLMILELGVTTFRVMSSPALLTILEAMALSGIWASTFFIQVPLHQSLISDPKSEHISKLVRTNWIRTSLWSLKGIFAILAYL